MTEYMIVRDTDDKDTEGYMLISQYLGKIRTLCLPDTQPKNLSAEKTFTMIATLLKEIENTVSHFGYMFSVKEKGFIKTYVKQIKNKIEYDTEQNYSTLSARLKEIYDCSTELRASLGVFRMTIVI